MGSGEVSLRRWHSKCDLNGMKEAVLRRFLGHSKCNISSTIDLDWIEVASQVQPVSVSLLCHSNMLLFMVERRLLYLYVYIPGKGQKKKALAIWVCPFYQETIILVRLFVKSGINFSNSTACHFGLSDAQVQMLKLHHLCSWKIQTLFHCICWKTECSGQLPSHAACFWTQLLRSW